MRLLVLCGAGGGAYFFLKGYPEGVPVLLRGCLAVVLLVGGLGWWAVGRKVGQKVGDVPVVRSVRRPRWTDYLAIGMGVLAVECGFLWLLSAAPRPLEEAAMGIEEKFFADATKVGEKAGGEAGVTGNWLWSETQERVLPRRTNLKPGAKPEVFIRLAEREDAAELLKRQVYVRAFALGEYRDGVWGVGRETALEVVAGGDGWVSLGRGDGTGKKGIFHEVFHGRSGEGKNMVTALQGVAAVRQPRVRTLGDGMAFLEGEGGAAGYRYLASSVTRTLADVKEAVAVREQAVGTVQGRFGRLAKVAAGEGALVDRLRNVERFLREGYRYSLVTMNRKNLDPMENFLYEEKRGHCEFFATAGALMARELGVESRVAYGWAGGQYFKEEGMFVFRAREAHAWVEVNLKGYGWVVMEPTPPVVLDGGGVPRQAGAGDPLPDEVENFSDEMKQGSAGESAHVGRVALGLMGVFTVVAAGVIGMRGKRGGTEVAGVRTQRKGGYFTAWQEAFRKKMRGGSPGLTLAGELALLKDKPDFHEQLLRYHYGVRYEGGVPDEGTERVLLQKIREWEGDRPE